MVENSPALRVVLIVSVCYAFSRIAVEAFQENDIITELKRNMEDVLEKQRAYDNEILSLRKTIKDQTEEIAELKELQVLQKRVQTAVRTRHLAPDSEYKTTNEDRNGKIRQHGETDKNDIMMNTSDTNLDKHNNKGDGRTENTFVPFMSHTINNEYNFEVDNARNEVRRRQVVAGGIAFSAFLDHDVDIGKNQILKFNKIITNEGNGYNVQTGAFTCPEGGMYLLTFFIGERGTTALIGSYVSLKVNNVNIIDAAVDTYHNTQDLQGGNSVIVRLKTGDVVFLDNGYSGTFHYEGSTGLRLTSFSGVLLYA